MKNGLFIRVERGDTLYNTLRLPIDYKEKRSRSVAYRRILRALKALGLVEEKLQPERIRSIALGFNNLGDLGVVVLFADEINIQPTGVGE